ncbi:MAG: hypothetical protein H0S79_12790 [Anaerolineaceae bacterium]|nr:hypothetical protein [Anaerolineaceae bacterium]
MNLQKVLSNYFKELDPDISEIVTDVYSLERNYMDYYGSNKGLLIKIKDIIDRVASLQESSEQKGGKS